MCNVSIVLFIILIIISIFKKILNKDGVSNYNFIQRNTMSYWLLISLSLGLSKIIYKTYLYFPIFFIIIYGIHELLWYKLFIQITKDEGEVTNNWYRWANIYTDKLNISSNNNSDLTEGIFDNNWSLSNEEAMLRKYKTYFNYLKLEPGMKLLDIGCGNCHWLLYCKKRGVECTGITITNDQKTTCIKNGLKSIIVGDVTKGVLNTLINNNKKFDAISAIGSAEHFSSISQPLQKRLHIFNTFYSQVKKLINPTSKSRRYINTIMQTNNDYSKYNNYQCRKQLYLVASAFGYGYYPCIGKNENEMEDIYNSKKSKIVLKRDITEDYRWIWVRDPNTVAYCNYKLNTPYRTFNFIKDILIDPAWFSRYLYGTNNSWLWQFGGRKQTPMPNNKDTPIRAIIYVTEIICN